MASLSGGGKVTVNLNRKRTVAAILESTINKEKSESESAEFLVCKTRSCSTLEQLVISNNTQHVTLKSPKRSNDDD